MAEPITPSLEDILPGLNTPADDKAAALTMPAGYPRIVPAGEDDSTMITDASTSVRDVRTPPDLLPVEMILADQLAVNPDRLRLIKAHISDFGAVTLWELLAKEGDTGGHYVVSYVAGGGRLQLAYAKRLEYGQRRFEAVLNAHREVTG